jgi:hypothetical protein
MSNILRRPMFRGGGKVSSYGNGIASGLGYAGGGQIGGGIIYGNPMPDGRYGFSTPRLGLGANMAAILADQAGMLLVLMSQNRWKFIIQKQDHLFL